MIRTIRKRDGRQVEYNRAKIAVAIEKAFIATGEENAVRDNETASERVARVVEERLEATGLISPSVEQIQDVVEASLIDCGYMRTARAYILYRAERNRVREMNTSLMKTYEEIAFKSALECDIKRENANIDADTPMGTMLKYGSEGAKKFYEMLVIDPDFVSAHKNGDIHIHDLDFYSLTTTCCQIDLIKLFDGGFSTGHGVLREPNDIASYSALACIAIQSNQNDQHGGQSIVNFDYAMARGVAKTYARKYDEYLRTAYLLLADDASLQAVKAVQAELRAKNILPTLKQNGYTPAERDALIAAGFDADVVDRAQVFARDRAVEATERATYQSMEALIHNLNTMHSRAGAQTPFSSINYGMDTSPEGRMVMQSLLLSTESGLGDGETPIFPIQIFRVKSGVNFEPGDPNYDLFQLACRVSSKRLFPNFSFMDAPFNARYYKEGQPETEIAYMGCRTRVIGNVHDRDREISNSRGNLSFTTVNLPRIAIKANGNISAFFSDLEKKMDLIIKQLLERYRIQSKRRVNNYPFLMGQGVWLDSESLGWNDEVGEILKHGTLSMGFIGLAETLKSLTGAHHGEDEHAQSLGLDIVRFMRQRLDRETETSGMNFTLLATPAEGLSGRFVRMDRQEFGPIPGVTDREYYTNSFHVPVYHKIGAAKKISVEAPYHELTNAGHITYVELDGDASQNPEAFEKIVRHMAKNGVGYGSINHPVDRDPVCGYNGIIGDTCPKCGRAETDGDRKFERIRRITGYLVGTVDRFNNAKRAEERDRVKHGLEELGKRVSQA
ncbi:anaerobic ribonucleoside triphosphate reductase [Synergistaceae bacterium OttesenSCG-928-I11]|nr:anaerobic ribonucleoside triphosphate reductase [Synergistaceae bacterium OttesenSCG-928-I11]